MKSMALVVLALAVMSSAQADPRLWPGLGVNLSHSSSIQFWSEGQTAADGAGNVVAVWTENRSGNGSVFAQAVDVNGTRLWDSAGIGVCTEVHDQYWPGIVATQGGFIVAWADYRSDLYHHGSSYSGGDIRAQKVSPTGNLLWSNVDSTGVPVDVTDVSVAGIQGMVSDGSGGAVIAWRTYTDGIEYGISVQRVNASGATVFPLTLSFAAGAASLENGFEICSDDSGGAIIAWGNDNTAMASRITVDGRRPWGDDGTVALLTGTTYYRPTLCWDGSGGAVVTMTRCDQSHRMQRLSSQGAMLWGDSGMVVPLQSTTSQPIRITPSVNNGSMDGCLMAIIVHSAGQTLFTNLQKVSLSGTPAWGALGTMLCDSSGEAWQAQIASDSAGGVIVARYEANYGGISGCKVSRLDSFGNSLWNSCEIPAFQEMYVQPNQSPVVHAQAGRVIVSGYQYSGGSSDDVNPRYQVLDFTTGTPLLADSGDVFIRDSGILAGGPGLAVALNTGRWLTVWGQWRDSRDHATYQILNADGSLERTANGELLLSLPDSSSYSTRAYAICPDGSGGAFVALYTGYYIHNYGRLTQINNAGERVGPQEGVIFTPGQYSDDLGGMLLAEDGLGGCYVGWRAYTPGVGLPRFRMQHYNFSLQPTWTSPLVLDSVYGMALMPSDSNTCILVGSYDSGIRSTLARKVDLNRETRWLTSVYDSLDFDVTGIEVTPDRQGGFYMGIQDQRVSGVNSADLFAQHVNSNGVELWRHNGVAVRIGDCRHFLTAAAVDLQNNLYLAWEDACSDTIPGYSIRVQRIRPDSSLCWSDSGVAMGNGSMNSDGWSALVVDAHNHLTAAWATSDPDYMLDHLRATQLDSSGQTTDPYWVAGQGNYLADTLSRTQYVTLLPDGNGGVLAVYGRSLNGSPGGGSDLCAQLIADQPLGTRPAAPTSVASFALGQAYPNPFNPVTQISFALEKSGMATLKVYDLLGREVATLMDRHLAAGAHTVSFDGSRLASGVYFYRLESGSFTATRKMILLK